MANIISKLKTGSDNTEYSIRATTLFSSKTGGNGAIYISYLYDSNGQMVSLDSYHHGLSFLLAFHTAPTVTTPTLNMNSMGAVPLYWGDSQSPMGKIVANTMYLVTYVYRGNVGETARFVITNPGSESGGGVSTPGMNVFAASPMGTQTEQTTDGNVYLNHVVGTQITSSEMLTGGGDGIWFAEEGDMLHLYNTSRLSISTNATTIGTPDTGNSNTYLNYAFANPDDSLTVVDSIKITGTGSTSVSYSNANKTLTINSTGGGGGGNTDLILSQTNVGTVHVSTIPSQKVHLNYIVNGNVARSIPIAPGNGMISVPAEGGAIKIYGPETANVFSNSNIGTVNATVGTSDTLYLNHVINGFVMSSLAIVGAGPSITANNGVMTIHHSVGGGGGGSMDFTQADFGVMGAFVGFLDDGTTQTPIAVEPARPDLVYNNHQFSRQGVVKPFLETRGAIPAYHNSSDSHRDWIITNEQLDRRNVFYADTFDIDTFGGSTLIAIPVVFDYSYNTESNRFESVPYILLPSNLSEHFDLVDFYGAGDNQWIADQDEDVSSRADYPIAPLLDDPYTFENGSIMDSYDPNGPGPM